MRQIGLSSEVLFSILFITAVAMFLIGLIGFKVTERHAIEGQLEAIKAVSLALENAYLNDSDLPGGKKFLETVLPRGTYGVIATRSSRVPFNTVSSGETNDTTTDPMILNVLNSGSTEIQIQGINFPPFSSYESIKIVTPIKTASGQQGALLVYQPLDSIEQSLTLSQRLVALWIILFLIIIGTFGFYIVSRRVIRPVFELIKTTESIAEGKFPETRNLGRIKEINQLHDALQTMYDQIEDGKNKLKGKIYELEETNARLTLTQKELIATEKLASLGKLSAGVAHEIGNPLSAIRGYVDVLKRIPETDRDNKFEFLQDIQKEVDRIDVIIRTLIDYSRPKNYNISAVNVNEVLDKSIDIVTKQGLLKNIEVKRDLEHGMRAAQADPDQLSQVIINLLLNAADAINENGEILISTSDSENGFVSILVSDNGEGISEQNIERIFDPFFTTKDPGRGTGLGLSVCLRIIETFGGKIKVESEPGHGTVFKINIPGRKG